MRGLYYLVPEVGVRFARARRPHGLLQNPLF